MSNLVIAFTILSFSSICILPLWRLYIHPLHAIPGPKLWIAFPILRYISLVRGTVEIDIRSSTSNTAWQDIYNRGHGDQQLPKAPLPTDNPRSILHANNANHTRFRRALSHAFSKKGLQEQEPILNAYVDKFIRGLTEISTSHTPVIDMVKWYNLATFDMIGDLAFGQPFGGLDSGEYHHWISTLFMAIRAMAWTIMADAHPLLSPILIPFLFLRRSLLIALEEHLRYGTAVVQKRLGETRDRGPADFMASMLRHRGDKEKELTTSELDVNANTLIIAGSETTAALLAGVTYWLLRTPEALQKVTKEVRTCMSSKADINFQNCSQRLPFMLACLNEGLRLYPPVSGGQQRVTNSPSMMNISGYMIPPGTKVSVHQSSAYLSSLNFYCPTKFLPERWLLPAKEDRTSPSYNDNRDVFQPFSVGPRNCIGRNLAYAEMRLRLARVLWHFDLELCPESHGWEQQRAIFLWEKKALLCRIKKR
ncbi:cytochrome P450 [Aspergillus karnatakaensis]|uniref:cytochrome P450 n=1 Tax=Aspergillus karnatakaensis TaxID=1810916 RepID=UPI003CCD637C